MIKFFRKIRKNLLNEGKTSKYFKYAIGEIVLVVIGILIALQINTWNQERILKSEETIILKNINAEFIQNKELLKIGIIENSQGLNAGKTLFNLIGKERIEIKKHKIDSLLFISLETGEFRPSENTISDLLQSGRLQLLQNKKLKDLLHQWSRVMKKSENSQARVEIKIDDELIPYLSKKYAMKDIDMYGHLAWKTKTTLNIDKLWIFEDIEFENILDDYLYRSIAAGNNLKELDKIINAIIKETEQKND